MGLLDQYAKFRDYIAANTPRSTRPVAKLGDVLREGLLDPNKFNAVAANRFKDSAFGLLGGIPGADAPVGFTQGADYFNRGEPLAGAVSVASGVLPFVPPTAAGLFALAKVADKIGTPLPAGPARNQAGAIVYHGSPHKFDKFDMSKIGTGEGAQAYGHGLYFAESPEVAKAYLPELDIDQARDIIGKQITDKRLRYGLRVLPDSANVGDVLPASYRWIDGNFTGKPLRGTSVSAIKNGDIVSALQNLGLYVKQGGNGFYFGDEVALVGGSNPKRGQDIGEWTLQNAKVLAKYHKKNKGNSNLVGGNLYKVDIPDEAIPRMLDWDKPLSEQAELVKMVQEVRPGYYSGGLPNASAPIGGSDAYLSLVETLGKQGATDFLKAKGYPGIRYLDGSSRNAGQGTSNFVLFDDQLPRILEINGQPTGLLSYADEAARKPKPKKAK